MKIAVTIDETVVYTFSLLHFGSYNKSSEIFTCPKIILSEIAGKQSEGFLSDSFRI